MATYVNMWQHMTKYGNMRALKQTYGRQNVGGCRWTCPSARSSGTLRLRRFSATASFQKFNILSDRHTLAFCANSWLWVLAPPFTDSLSLYQTTCCCLPCQILLQSPLGWHYLSNATCLMQPRLFYAFLVVSRITIICHILRHFWRTPALDK